MAKATSEDGLELARARYGLFAVVGSNVLIALVAVIGVWRLDGNTGVVVGVLTAAFTAVSTMTTAYLSIKAMSNTAKTTMALDESRRRQQQQPEPASVPAQTQAQGDA